MKKEQVKTCKTCEHFKCNQRELNYWKHTGFCTNDRFKFNTVDGRLIGVYDKENLRNTQQITGNPAHNIETISNSPYKVSDSRYCLQVSDGFGCIYHESNK